MSKRNRILVDLDPLGDPVHLAERYNRYVSRHPEVLRHTDEEVSQFLSVAAALDDAPLDQIRIHVEGRSIRVPPWLWHDRYRICRFLLRQWLNPEIRRKLSEAVVLDKRSPSLQAARNGDLGRMVAGAEGFNWPLADIYPLCVLNRPDLIEPYKAALSPERMDWYRANLAYGRYLMLRHVYECKGLGQLFGLAEQQKIVQRIARRELKLQSMRRSLYSLGQERKALTTSLRQTDQASREELAALIARLDRAQVSLAAAEGDHAAAVALRTDEYQRRMATLEHEIAATQADFAAALVERSRWMPVDLLGGLKVAIVGDTGREGSYRALVESAGGRLLQVSALEKLSRIPEAVATADVIILMTAIAKHQAEHRLRKAAPPSALILRCPKAGLGALERTLRTEVLPRIALHQTAGTGRRGGEARA